MFCKIKAKLTKHRQKGNKEDKNGACRNFYTNFCLKSRAKNVVFFQENFRRTKIYFIFAIRLRKTLKSNNPMAVTRLERKGLRNKARANNKQKKIKQLNAQPVIKKVDVEAIKAEWENK